MTKPHGSSSRRSAFTLVELLTVIGIISLLISIMVPSLARARDVAKKTATQAELDAMGKGLEIFSNEFGAYPESDSQRLDPVQYGGAVANMAPDGVRRLTGAHWVARALVGPDLQGIDTGGYLVRDKDQTYGDPATGKIGPPGASTGVDFTVLARADRKGDYLDPGKLLVRDNDASKLTNQINSPNTGCLIVIDSFNGPILYYKAHPRAPYAFANVVGNRFNTPGTDPSTYPAGVYNQNDNATITGSGTSAASAAAGWDFGASGMEHGIGYFGAPNYVTNPDSVESMTPSSLGPTFKGKSFVDYLHEHRTHETGGVIKAVSPETFVLISAGKDGIYGTEDDVNNFNK